MNIFFSKKNTSVHAQSNLGAVSYSYYRYYYIYDIGRR